MTEVKAAESSESTIFQLASGPNKGQWVEIRDVWADNLEEEMAVIREIVTKYKFVAMVKTRLLQPFLSCD